MIKRLCTKTIWCGAFLFVCKGAYGILFKEFQACTCNQSSDRSSVSVCDISAGQACIYGDEKSVVRVIMSDARMDHLYDGNCSGRNGEAYPVAICVFSRSYGTALRMRGDCQRNLSDRKKIR